MPPLNPSSKEKNNTPALQWTGNAIDLVEMIYGISEMGCINNGNIQPNELAPVLYTFFGVNSKDWKNDSRTYFLDKMQVKLNIILFRVRGLRDAVSYPFFVLCHKHSVFL